LGKGTSPLKHKKGEIQTETLPLSVNKLIGLVIVHTFDQLKVEKLLLWL